MPLKNENSDNIQNDAGELLAAGQNRSVLLVSSVFCVPSFLGNGWRVASLFGSSWVAAFPEEAAFRCEHEQVSLDPGGEHSLPDVGLEPHDTEPDDERPHL